MDGNIINININSASDKKISLKLLDKVAKEYLHNQRMQKNKNVDNARLISVRNIKAL